jgi:hypothetical protein
VATGSAVRHCEYWPNLAIVRIGTTLITLGIDTETHRR